MQILSQIFFKNLGHKEFLIKNAQKSLIIEKTCKFAIKQNKKLLDKKIFLEVIEQNEF